LAVALDLHAPSLSRVDAEDLMRRAHALCLYSNATRGNVDVTPASTAHSWRTLQDAGFIKR
jgi:organic hydroperoxide reductase OsmC/OhrA